MALSATVYTTPGCVQCTPTKRKLDAAGFPFEEVDLSLPEHAAKAAEFRNAGHMQAPVVVTSDGETWNGFRPDLLGALIARAKEGE